jgi:hypothetical protein
VAALAIAGLSGGGYALASAASPAASIPAANNQLYACVTYNPATKVPRTVQDAYTSKASFLAWLSAQPGGKCPDGGFAVGLAPGGTTAALPTSRSVFIGPNTKPYSQVQVSTGLTLVDVGARLGYISLPSAGTYQVTVNATASPRNSSPVEIFPQFSVYNGAAKADNSNDLFDAGSGALATNNTSIDSHYSGTDEVTVTGPATLEVYAWGQDSDGGASVYNLSGLSATVTQLSAGG